ncbi:diguanylate cyclase (GGDEF)-like protein [Paucibacter oligotrophus]|uniref:diguanylate cyclase n=1 Tax=Roseateles oligotrophus TaxID=1769250 RepID=A0A840LHB5_9BURK|nr:sensor domain-containing diguanylate cyclase [Roseateles oligotrophus]MBB4845993.1 diguanylate cyclase (GGDEF)-like protein [Roseateles oligotrophus]
MNSELLAAENQALKQQLQSLLHEARLNEDKMQRFERLEHQLIAAHSLQGLVSLLLRAYKQAFAIDHVALLLLDPAGEVDRMLQTETGSLDALPGLRLYPAHSGARLLEAAYCGTRKPRLGAFDAGLHAQLFAPAAAPDIRSMALLPLARHGQLIGGLHFGSVDAARYEAGAGTHLLERLANIVAVCLESAFNQERLKRLGLTDTLTGVHNRRYFEHRCLIEIAQARRYRHPLACLFLDVDKFKSINDRFGHATGDEVLRGIGHLIQGQLRAGDTIARYGGEEFVVLLPQTSAEFAREIAERIRASVAQQRFVAAAPLPDGSGSETPAAAATLSVTASLGLAMLPSDTAGMEASAVAERLVAAADQALYQAKELGRNRVVAADRPASTS